MQNSYSYLYFYSKGWLKGVIPCTTIMKWKSLVFVDTQNKLLHRQDALVLCF